jgi:hypothetical protein
VHPGADFVTDVPPDGSTGDWNCDGVVTKQFDASPPGACRSMDCLIEAGAFQVDLGCGEIGDFYFCQNPSVCPLVPGSKKRAQGCR